MTPGPHDSSLPPAERSLRELGYAILWRETGWHECLVSGHGEAWHGHGPTPADALQHALRQALPSHASRAAFDVLCGDRQPAAAAPQQQPAAATEPPEEEPAPPPAAPAAPAVLADEAPAVDASDDAPTRIAPTAEAPTAEAPTAEAPTAEAPTLEAPAAHAVDDAAPAAAGPDPARTVVVPRPEPKPPLPRRPLAEVLAGLDAIDEAIAAAEEEAGLLAPERQRLLLLSWIAAARALEGQSGGAHEAFVRTRQIAQRCSRLAKIWWPGTVRALAIDATPGACSDELAGEPPPDLTSWAGVAAAAEASLAALEQDDTGRDEHGWSDASALEPRHHRPDVLLRETVALLEKTTGPIVRASDAGECAPRVAADRQVLQATLAPWLAGANRLRWVRGAVLDLELWAAAMGRFRWLTVKLPRAWSEPLLRALDPATSPALGWAKELGYDPDKRRRQRERKLLLSAPPEPEWTAEQLREWLLRAIDLGDEMPKDRIAALVAGMEDRVLAIAPAEFSTRRNQRVRLDAVQRLLRKQQQPVAAAAVQGAAEDDDDAADADGESPSLEVRLIATLQEYTRGRSALFVTNRNDSANAEQVRELLQFAAVDVCESKSSTLAAKARSIGQESYDFVLAATGFLSHTTDSVLKAAAKRAGIPYVSVNRGRPLSCARALARELGVAVPAL